MQGVFLTEDFPNAAHAGNYIPDAPGLRRCDCKKKKSDNIRTRSDQTKKQSTARVVARHVYEPCKASTNLVEREQQTEDGLAPKTCPTTLPDL